MMRASWAFGIGVLFLIASLGMLFTENPWGAVLPFLIGVCLCWLGCVDTEPVESEHTRRLEDARRMFDK